MQETEFLLCKPVSPHLCDLSRPLEEVTTRQELDAVVALMRDFPHPWGVAGGWALDLFLGRETRVHADIEVIVFRDCQHAFREHFPTAEFDMVALIDGIAAWQPWPEEIAVELPFHQIRARLPNGVIVEGMLNERCHGMFISRRHEGITLPVERLWRQTANGVPYLAPEIQLFYKAKHHREKDERDFAMIVPHLDAAQRDWLGEAIRLSYPDDPWLQRL
jgi:hypothetical protein